MNKILWLEFFKVSLYGKADASSDAGLWASHSSRIEFRKNLVESAGLIADEAVKFINEKFGEDCFLSTKEQELCQTIDDLEKELKKK